MKEAADWGVGARERAAESLACTTAVHVCYGYRIQANLDGKAALGHGRWPYQHVFPARANSRDQQVPLKCIHSPVPMALMRLLAGKDVLTRVIHVASNTVETPEEVAPPSAARRGTSPVRACTPAPTVAWRRCRGRSG